MYRIDREERSKIAKDIVSTTRIRTISDFNEEYNRRYPDNYIAISTARRIMVDAGIAINHETGLYEYHPEPKATHESVLKDILSLRSYRCHNIDKFHKFILLSVGVGYEKTIANLIYDIWEDSVFVILGYGCIQIYYKKQNIYKQILNMLSREKE